MDRDKNGYLSKEEVKLCFYDLGYDKYFVKTFMKKFDIDGDGKITLDEYKRALGFVPETKKQCETWHHVFNDIDKDKSGKISSVELMQLLKDMNFECNFSELEELMYSHGVEKDGEMDYDTFLTLMTL